MIEITDYSHARMGYRGITPYFTSRFRIAEYAIDYAFISSDIITDQIIVFICTFVLANRYYIFAIVSDIDSH